MPTVQAEFATTRGAISFSVTMIFLGFGLGGVIMGRITDKVGIVAAMAVSITLLTIAYVLAGLSTALWQFIAVSFLIGLGASATFAPLMAEASHWFERYRGLAVTIVASGNYVAGTVWPPIVNWGTQTYGWRATHIGIGIFCGVSMMILLMVLRAIIGVGSARDHANAPPPRVDLNLSTNTLTVLLCIASISCCVAMAMPQVHLVAYCGDLGYGVARGAEMLSMMMAFGIVSRIGSGFIADRFGGLVTLMIGRSRAGLRAVVLSVLRQPDLALPDLRDVRPVPGRHRAELRHHRARCDAGARGRDARRDRDLRLGVRNVVRRLDFRRDLRRHRLLCRRLRQRLRLERRQHGDRAGPVVARARPRPARGGVTPTSLRPSSCISVRPRSIAHGDNPALGLPARAGPAVQKYRFANIGGTSAGAMAAAAAAAAEYGRGIPNAGFDRLAKVPKDVGSRLMSFFQPTPKLRPLFNIFVSALGAGSGLGRFVAIAVAAICGYWLSALLGRAARLSR